MIKMLRMSCVLIKDEELLLSPWIWNDFEEILFSKKGRREEAVLCWRIRARDFWKDFGAGGGGCLGGGTGTGDLKSAEARP